VSREITFGRKEAADKYREEHEEFLCSEDDARLKTVRFSSDAPEWLIEQAQLEAMESRGEQEQSTGQVPLSDHERGEIDFSKARASVPHARAVKAIAREQGIDDWLAHYDPTLGVDEHRSTFEEITPSGGRHLDSHEERQAQRRRDAARTAQSEQCDHARGHCQNGDPSACEFLRDACGFDQEEIDEFLDPDDADQDGAGGRSQEITGKAAGAMQRAWDGYRASISLLDESVKDYLRPEWDNAQQAARAINAIRDEHGQDPLHFERLEEIQADILDLARKMAGDCHECHASHESHDHNTTAGDREDVREFVREGADETPVGTSEQTAKAIETDDQRTLVGERANDQARLAGGESGEQETEIEATEEENPGGLRADRRDDPGETETEQSVPEEFRVAEGGQDTL